MELESHYMSRKRRFHLRNKSHVTLPDVECRACRRCRVPRLVVQSNQWGDERWERVVRLLWRCLLLTKREVERVNGNFSLFGLFRPGVFGGAKLELLIVARWNGKRPSVVLAASAGCCRSNPKKLLRFKISKCHKWFLPAQAIDLYSWTWLLESM